MTFYPSPFGHIEIRVDHRDPRPPRFAREITARVRRRARRER
jgi:hypothetical protein